ncbi:Uncharacterized protein T03_3711 [Trichinella britovi]|uniref:Uncharacterized protein n=1 Tax=Trichinella britovi TaxID=45882 RepID=A0A0V1D696_TRIBR|nr:Uncharacterized protein T03_3711 [Trichinella britovi]
MKCGDSKHFRMFVCVLVRRLRAEVPGIRTGAVNKDAAHWLVRIDRFTNVYRLLEWEFDWLPPFPPAGSVEAAVIERFILPRMFGKVFGGITHAVSHTASQLRTQVLAPQFNATVDPLAGLSEVERAHILAVQRRAADEDFKLSQQPMVLPRSTASTVDATASLPPPSLAPSTLPSRPSSASSTETEGADDTSDDDDDDSGPIPDLDQIGLSEVTPADMRLDGLAEIGQERLLTSQESIEEQPTIVVHSPSTNSNGAVDESDANELEREEEEDERQQQHAEEDSLDELEHYSSPESDTQDVVEPVVQIPGDQENLQLAATGAGDESPSSSGDEWNCEYAGESFTAPIRKSIEIDEPTTTPSITLTAVEGEHEEEEDDEDEEEDDDDNDQATVVSFSQSNERPIYQTEPAASSPPPAADTTASSLFNYDQTDPTEWTNVEPLLQTQEIELSSNETDQSVMNKAPGVEMDEEASSQTFYGDESSNPFLDGASFADDQAISELVPVEEPDEEVDEEKFNNDNEQQLVIDASADEQLSAALAEPIPSSDDDTFGVDEKIISQAEKTFATVADHADSFGISNIAAAASSVVIERQTSRFLTEMTSRSVKQPFDMPAASQAKLQSANKIASAALDGFGGKSLKNFGGLFSRPKVDFSSFATSVKKSTEAALKKATDSVASSFSSSSVVSMSQDSFNSNNQTCTVPPKSPSSSAINADNASVNSNKSSDQWSALEVDKADNNNNNNSSAVMKSTAAAVVGKKGIQPSPVVSNTFRVSCNSDSTEDTGYSSRCSPEDEFYRVGSDGAQFLITYDSSRKLGVDTVKAPLSPRRRINPFIEDGIFSQRLITSVIVEQADDQLTKSFHVSGQKRQLDIVEKVEPGEQEKFHLIAEQSFWSSEPLQSQQLFGEIDGPQEISQAGKDSTPKIEEVETLPLPDESTPLKYPPQQSIANSGADEIAKLFAVEDSAPDSSACTQMYDSSEVSSEQFDEDAQKRITEIESEFLLQNNQSADSAEDWQMCPLCQMAEVHVRPDGVSINGQPCGNCGLTVCSKCGHVVEQNGRKVWLCGICDSNIAEANGRWYCDGTKSQAISEDDNSKLTFEKSQEVDSDISDQASDSSDSYPDVVIEVPSSPVKQLDFDQEFSTSNSKQCYKVFRDIEKHFMNNFDQCDDTKHEGKVDHHDQQTGHSDKGNFETDPFKTVPISVGQSPTFEKLTEQASPSDAQLSIGEEIFGKIVPPEQSCPSTNSNNAQEDSIDYAQAMRYYNTQPFYIHRPGPVYTILEDDEEVMELNQDAISASRPSTLSSSSSKSQLTSFSSPLANSYVGLDRPAQQMQTSSNASTEQLTSTVSSDVLVQHFFATSTTSTTTTSITASKSHALQSNSTFTPKPVRIAPPPPPPSQYSISRDAKIEKSIHQETSNKPTGGRRHSADVPLSTDVNDSVVSGSLNGTAFKPVHSSSSTWTILAGQKKSDTPSSSTVAVSFALPVVRTIDMDASDPSSCLPLYSAASTLCTTATTAPATTPITTNEADDDEAVVECSGTGPFVSRLKRSPAMLLNCIKNETDLRAGSLQTALQSTPTSALTACSSTSYPSSRLIDSAIPTPTKVVSSTSCGDTLQSGKTFLNERLFFAQASPGEMGRRKLPNIPKIASNRHQQDVDEQLCNISWSAGPVCSSTTTVNGSGITGITGGSSYNNVISMPSSWKNIGQTLRPQHSTPLATNCRRLLPPTLARVLLKQELREALTKRLDKLEAAEIEANQREFVVGRYMATGVYPQSAGVDSAPSVVRCGLSPEMVRGCVVHFDRSRYLSSIRQRESSKAEFSNSYGQSSRYGSYGGEEQWNSSRLVRKKESFVKKDDSVVLLFVKFCGSSSVQTKRNDFTVQTSDVLERYKDASTQTVQQSSETTNSGNFVRFKPKDDLLLSKHKNVGVSTSEGPTCRTISTSTDEIDEDRLMARRRSEGNKKWRNLNSKSFTYFSADDDFASRESRRSKIRREIARRREKFSSYEDLFNLPPHRADSTYRYMDDGMELNNYLTPSLYSSSRFSGHYGSLPRIDRLYDYSPMSRNALYDDEPSSFSASYPLRPYQKYDRLYRSDTAPFVDGQDSAFHRGNYGTLTWRDQKPWFIDGQRSLSSSLPYLNNLYESLDSQPECSFRGYSRGRRFGEAGTEQVNTPRSSSMLSHYANYLHNDFLRRSSALDDGYGNLCEDRSTAKCMPYADSSTEFNCRPSSVMEPIASRLPYDKYDEPLNDCLSLHRCRTDAPMETYPSTRDYCSMTAQQPTFNSRRRRSRRQQDQEPLYSGVKSAQYDADLKTQSYNPYLIDSSLQNASVENHHRQRASSQILLEEGKSTFRQASSPSSANIKRLLLVRDVRDRSGHGIGMRVIGGKILPGSDGELVAYVAAVYKGGLVDLMEEVKEGDQILEWNGIKLTGKTYEEVQSIIDNTEGEFEIVLRSDANLNQVYRLEEGPSSSLDKGYESDCYLSNLAHPRLAKLALQRKTGLDQTNDRHCQGLDFGKASPCFSTTPRSRSPFTANQQQNSLLAQDLANEGLLKLRVCFDHTSDTLFVTVLCAARLPNVDAKKRRPPNPFVKIYILPERIVQNKRRTKFIARSNNPVWNQTVVYKDLNLEQALSKMLEFTVWSYDRFKQNTFLGKVIINLSAANRWKKHDYTVIPFEVCISMVKMQLFIHLIAALLFLFARGEDDAVVEPTFADLKNLIDLYAREMEAMNALGTSRRLKTIPLRDPRFITRKLFKND